MERTLIIAEAEAHMVQALDLLDQIGELDASPYLDSALERLRNRDLKILSGVVADTVQ